MGHARNKIQKEGEVCLYFAKWDRVITKGRLERRETSVKFSGE